MAAIFFLMVEQSNFCRLQNPCVLEKWVHVSSS